MAGFALAVVVARVQLPADNGDAPLAERLADLALFVPFAGLVLRT